MKTSSNPSPLMLFNDTRSDRHFGCEAVVQGLLKLLQQAGLPEPECAAVSQSSTWFENEALMNRACSSRMIVVNGEGSIHHNNKRAKGLSRLAPWAKNHHICSVLLNATLYSNDAALYGDLSHYDLVYVRDSASQVEAQRHGVKAKWAPDLTFFHQLPVSQRNTPTRDETAPLGQDVRVSDSVKQGTKGRLRELAAQNGWQSCGIHSRAPEHFRRYVEKHGNAGFVVTGRFHDVCFCINAEIPFVAIESNTNKIEALLGDVFGTTERILRPCDLAASELNKYRQFSLHEMESIELYKDKAVVRFKEMENDLTSFWTQSVA